MFLNTSILSRFWLGLIKNLYYQNGDLEKEEIYCCLIQTSAKKSTLSCDNPEVWSLEMSLILGHLKSPKARRAFPYQDIFLTPIHNSPLSFILLDLFLLILTFQNRSVPIFILPISAKGLPWRLGGKDAACNAGDVCSIPGSGRSPGGGNGNPLQYSCMRNSIDRGACRLQSMGSQRVRHHWASKQQQRKQFQQNHYPSCSKASSMWTYFSFIPSGWFKHVINNYLCIPLT